jgi:uncharacterized protein
LCLPCGSGRIPDLLFDIYQKHPSIMTLPVLSQAEARVLGVLVEKQRTVPDTYPLTLNALVAGCNQKTSREPILSLSDSETQATLDSLKSRSMVVETSGGRVMRYAHNVERALSLPSQSVALLAALFLRGPQTAGELRINSERWYRFADISSVDAFLEELRDRSEEKGGPLVVLLPRAPGMREQRWAHLLCGPVDAGEPAAGTASEVPRHALEARVQALETEVAALRSAVQNIREELGLSQPGHAP